MNIKISGGKAPWMITAIRESKQWKGDPEGEIRDSYFKLISFDYDTIIGDGYNRYKVR